MVVGGREGAADSVEMGFASRLDRALSHYGIKQDRFRRSTVAKLFGVSIESVRKWLEGESLPQQKRTMQIAEKLGVRAQWLLTGEEPMVSDDAASSSPIAERVEIRIWDARGASGHGALNDQARVIGTLTFKKRSLSRKSINADAAEAFYVDGDSMMPRLQDGDAVLFDTSDTKLRDGKVYVFNWNGRDYVKRLRFYEGRWHISSDNKADPEWRDDKPIDPVREPFIVRGRVRWIGSWED